MKIELTGDGCAIRDSNPEPADYAPLGYAPVLVLPVRRPVLRPLGGAA